MRRSVETHEVGCKKTSGLKSRAKSMRYFTSIDILMSPHKEKKIGAWQNSRNWIEIFFRKYKYQHAAWETIFSDKKLLVLEIISLAITCAFRLERQDKFHHKFKILTWFTWLNFPRRCSRMRPARYSFICHSPGPPMQLAPCSGHCSPGLFD